MMNIMEKIALTVLALSLLALITGIGAGLLGYDEISNKAVTLALSGTGACITIGAAAFLKWLWLDV